MLAPRILVACPSCGCHVHPDERRCAHCDAPIRRKDGSVPRTAAALLLGLTALAVAPGAGCSSDVTTPEGASGGVTGAGGGGGGGGSSSSSQSSTTGQGGAGGTFVTVASSSSGGGQGGAVPLYGVAASDDDGDGYLSVEGGGNDCDDQDAAVHPEAPDPAGDGVDSDCDGVDG